MKKEERTYFIKKEQEGSYLKIPFEVPKNIDYIIIEYDYMRFEERRSEDNISKKEINVIDFGLYSNNAFLGASGSNRNRIKISSHSDPGFANIQIEEGIWYIMAGAYKVDPSGVEVHYTIHFFEKKRGLYKGDTHTHTLSSDGSYSYEELTQKAKREGLDFMILTDHNTYDQNEQVTGKEDLTVIPGTEWTHYQGHANLLGLKKSIEDPFSVTHFEQMDDVLNEAKNNGAVISVNHPFCPFCGWEWGIEDTAFDLVEIWNGGILPTANKKALEWWSSQLDSGKKISMIAGSDFHDVKGLRNIGQPCLGVWANANAGDEILGALKRGNSYASFAVEGPSILIESSAGIQGDTVSAGEVSILIGELKKGDRIVLISDKKKEEIIVEEDYSMYKIKKTYTEEAFFRVEIYREPFSKSLEMPVSLSNPIYFTL